MIGEYLFDIIFKIVEGVFVFLPEWSWNVENAFFSSALDMVRLAGYMLPMGTIVDIIIVINILLILRIIIAIIKTIWELLPLV